MKPIINNVFVFGAGATKACGGPLTKEILPDAFRQGASGSAGRKLDRLARFLSDVFHIDPRDQSCSEDDYPPLPALLTFVDTALDRGEDVTRRWPRTALPAVRAAIEYCIFVSLNERLKDKALDWYRQVFMDCYHDCSGPLVVSLNYDTLVDRAIFEVGAWVGGEVYPDYGWGAPRRFREARPARAGFGKLFKLHGSVDWFRCFACHLVELLPSDFNFRRMVVPPAFMGKARLSQRYESAEAKCSACGGAVGPLLIAPTQRKVYKSPHLDAVWRAAEETLRRASRVYVVGYSLPEDDVEVRLLLRRSLDNLPSSRITVVEHDAKGRSLRQNPIGRRYAALFGDVGWHPGGFGAWVEEQRRTGAWRATPPQITKRHARR